MRLRNERERLRELRTSDGSCAPSLVSEIGDFKLLLLRSPGVQAKAQSVSAARCGNAAIHALSEMEILC